MKMKYNIKVLIYLLVSLLSTANALADDSPYYGTPPDGWYWGRVAPPVENLKSAPAPKTGMQTLEVVKRAVNEAKARAILNPSTGNVWKYLVIQNWAQITATHFSEQALNVMAIHPELNFAIVNPETAGVRQVQLQEQRSEKEIQAKNLASNNGLFFFYRGSNPMDVLQAETVGKFSIDYGFSLIGIPVDGKAYSAITNRDDSGQANNLGVKAYPALFLINPQSQAVRLIAYGYPSREELLSALIQQVYGKGSVSSAK